MKAIRVAASAETMPIPEEQGLVNHRERRGAQRRQVTIVGYGTLRAARHANASRKVAKAPSFATERRQRVDGHVPKQLN
jgi:hypothetical protein